MHLGHPQVEGSQPHVDIVDAVSAPLLLVHANMMFAYVVDRRRARVVRELALRTIGAMQGRPAGAERKASAWSACASCPLARAVGGALTCM